MDSEVCAFLRTQDRTSDAEKELEVLEMENDIAKWLLEHARREAIETARMVEANDAADHETNPRTQPTAVVGLGDQEDIRMNSVNYYLPAPVDITGLLPPPSPHAEDSSNFFSLTCALGCYRGRTRRD